MLGAGAGSRLGIQLPWETYVTYLVWNWGCELAVWQLVFDGLVRSFNKVLPFQN